jgi:uncharacterized protein (DUF2236 family)
MVLCIINDKPTTTDITINYISNHLMEQKIAAYRYFINRMMTFPLDKENKRKEWITLCKIAHNNNFPHNIIKELKNRMEHNITQQKLRDNTKKWATFTYYSPQMRKVTNLFKHTETRIAFRSNNNIQQLVRTKKKTTERNTINEAVYTH